MSKAQKATQAAAEAPVEVAAEPVHTGPVRVNMATGVSAVYVPELGNHLVPDPLLTYPPDHPMVRVAPWMFVSEEEHRAQHADRVGINHSGHTPIGG